MSNSSSHKDEASLVFWLWTRSAFYFRSFSPTSLPTLLFCMWWEHSFARLWGCWLWFLTVRDSEIRDAIWKVYLPRGSVDCGHQVLHIWPIYARVHKIKVIKVNFIDAATVAIATEAMVEVEEGQLQGWNRRTSLMDDNANLSSEVRHLISPPS